MAATAEASSQQPMNAAFLAPPFAGHAKIIRYCRLLGIQLVLLQIPASRSGRQAWAGVFFADIGKKDSGPGLPSGARGGDLQKHQLYPEEPTIPYDFGVTRERRGQECCVHGLL